MRRRRPRPRALADIRRRTFHACFTKNRTLLGPGRMCRALWLLGAHDITSTAIRNQGVRASLRARRTSAAVRGGGGEGPTPTGGDEGDGRLEGGEEEPVARQKIKIKLADGKERTIQHMMATTFWSVDGRPMSAAEFITRLFGDLPELFKDEDELRALWGQPDTRKAHAALGFEPRHARCHSRQTRAQDSSRFRDVRHPQMSRRLRQAPPPCGKGLTTAESQ
jgi:hypothetical protein